MQCLSSTGCRLAFVLTGVAVMAAGIFVATPTADAQTTINFYNGPPQGSWRPFANAFKRAIEKEIAGSKVKILPGGGLSNVIAVEAGKGHIGMVASAPLFSGFDGKRPFKAKTKNVRVLATLYVQPIYIMTLRSGIHTVADLKGKRVSVMPKGYAAERVNQLILKTAGLSYADIHEQFLGEVDTGDALRDGHLDAFMGMGSIPYSVAIDLATTGKLRLIPLTADQKTQLRAMNRGFFQYTLKGGMYRGVPEPYSTLAVTVLMIANANLSNEAARGATKALVEILPEMQRIFVSFKVMTPNSMAQDIGIPFHPGAAAYYRSAGIASN